MKPKRLISLPAALVVVFCFFLPWISVSCSGQELVRFTGMDLASGRVINPGFGVEPQRIGGDALLYLVPVVAVVAALLALAGASTRSKGPGVGQLLAGVVGLGIMMMKWLTMNDEAASFAGNAGLGMGNMFEVSIRIGVWGTLLGLIGIVLGGMIGVSESSSLANDPWRDGWDDRNDGWDKESSSFY